MFKKLFFFIKLGFAVFGIVVIVVAGLVVAGLVVVSCPEVVLQYPPSMPNLQPTKLRKYFQVEFLDASISCCHNVN